MDGNFVWNWFSDISLQSSPKEKSWVYYLISEETELYAQRAIEALKALRNVLASSS